MSEFILISGALAASIAAVLCLAIIIHWGNKRNIGLMPYFFYVFFFSYALQTMMSGRDLNLPIGFDRSPIANHSTFDYLLDQIVGYFAIFAFIERFLHTIFSQNKKTEFPQFLLFSLVFYVLTNIISPGIFGANPYLTHSYVPGPAICLVSFLINRKESELAFQTIRNALVLFLLAGLIAIFVAPQLVFQSNYQYLIPFLTIRLAGLSQHANSLGELSVIFILFLWRFPFLSRWMTTFAWLLGIANLILAQSKTSWIEFILCASIMIYFTYSHRIKEYIFNHEQRFFSVFLVGSTILLSLVVGSAFMFGGLTDSISNVLRSSVGQDLSSFTGRDIIWDIAIGEWHKHPIFGYGLTLWDENFRKSIGLAYAFTAHSQFYQSLASAGTVGISGLVFYLCTLFYFSLITSKKSQGLSLALFTIILSGCFTEAPLMMRTPGGCTSQALLLIVLIYFYEPRGKKIFSIKAERQHVTAEGVS